MTHAVLRFGAVFAAASLFACTSQPGEDAKASPLQVDKTFSTSATANTQFVDAVDCVTTSAFVNATNITVNGELSTGSQIGLFRSNGCDGTTLFFASAPVPGVLTVNEQSAHFVADGSLLDLISNARVDVHVDLTWDRLKTGTSDMCTHRSAQPGLKLTDHLTTEFDDAPATGTVSANGENFAVGESEFSFVATFDDKTFRRN